MNPAYVDRLQQSGLCFVGKDEKGRSLDHPYFLGLQAHPEFCMCPLNPSPPFLGFVAAASSKDVLEEQLESQKIMFKPPHPEHAMVNETELKAGKGLKEVFVTSLTEVVGRGGGCRMGWRCQRRQGSEEGSGAGLGL